MDIRIYVGNLAKSTTEDEIKALFVQEGEVTKVDLVKDRDSGLSKGFAFVTMASQESADKAIAKYNGFSLGGECDQSQRRQAPRGAPEVRLSLEYKKPRLTARFLFNGLILDQRIGTTAAEKENARSPTTGIRSNRSQRLP